MDLLAAACPASAYAGRLPPTRFVAYFAAPMGLVGPALGEFSEPGEDPPALHVTAEERVGVVAAFGDDVLGSIASQHREEVQDQLGRQAGSQQIAGHYGG